MQTQTNQPIPPSREEALIFARERGLKFSTFQVLFEDYIEERIEKQKNKITKVDKDELIILQGVIKELQAIKNEIKRYVEVGDKALAELTDNK